MHYTAVKTSGTYRMEKAEGGKAMIFTSKCEPERDPSEKIEICEKGWDLIWKRMRNG